MAKPPPEEPEHQFPERTAVEGAMAREDKRSGSIILIGSGSHTLADVSQ